MISWTFERFLRRSRRSHDGFRGFQEVTGVIDGPEGGLVFRSQGRSKEWQGSFRGLRGFTGFPVGFRGVPGDVREVPGDVKVTSGGLKSVLRGVRGVSEGIKR